ncbi:MAG: aromatic ring-hydroxylating dioxygenase subunit alpha [Acidobacteria bacterium]|nr:aromatic ring-hydroxylating dioxygenase subunit alpha [Acidobacteriota bacterium]
MATQAEHIGVTLPARYYVDPDVYKQEIDRFFCRMWVCAGRADQVSNPGDYFLRELANESIIVIRDNQRQIRAFYNVCRHRGTRMCTVEEGKFSGRIQCPYHGWTYGLDGKLIGAPHMEGLAREEYPLHGVRTELWDGHIFINLQSQAAPLAAQLQDLPQKFANWRMQDLRLYKRKVYDVKANWKFIILNYNECLHCPVLHPTLNKLTDYMSGDNADPNRGYVGGSMGFKDGVKTMSLDGKLRRDYLPCLTEKERQEVQYYSIYPNLLLSLHPDYMMLHTLWPKAVDRTEIICEMYFHPQEMAKPDFQGDDAVEFWDRTNKEDWSVSELSQLGIQSRSYTPGPYSARERLPHAFEQMILQREREDR